MGSKALRRQAAGKGKSKAEETVAEETKGNTVQDTVQGGLVRKVGLLLWQAGQCGGAERLLKGQEAGRVENSRLLCPS